VHEWKETQAKCIICNVEGGMKVLELDDGWIFYCNLCESEWHSDYQAELKQQVQLDLKNIDFGLPS